jgi:hypothetical protein
MRYKIKWRSGGDGPLAPELFDDDPSAKARVRELLGTYGTNVTIDVWNESETWRIVTSAGIAEWCKAE